MNSDYQKLRNHEYRISIRCNGKNNLERQMKHISEQIYKQLSELDVLDNMVEFYSAGRYTTGDDKSFDDIQDLYNMFKAALLMSEEKLSGLVPPYINLGMELRMKGASEFYVNLSRDVDVSEERQYEQNKAAYMEYAIMGGLHEMLDAYEAGVPVEDLIA